MEVLCVKKGLKAISGFSRIEVLSSLIIIAATLGMGMRTYIQADNHLQLAAADVQFQAEAQMALVQMSSELRQASDAQIVDNGAVLLVKALPTEQNTPKRYQMVSYWYENQNGKGALMRSVHSHGSQSKLQPHDLQSSNAQTTGQTADHKQVLLTDSNSEGLENTQPGSSRINYLTLRLLAATPARIVKKHQAKI